MGIGKTLASIVLAGAMTLGLSGKTNAGLIGEWNFNEGSGSVAYDSGGQGRDGTINGATYVGGKDGTGLYFNGNSYVEIPNTSDLHFHSGFTLSAWVKFDTYNADNMIVGKHISGIVSGYFLNIFDNKLTFYVSNAPLPGNKDRLKTPNNYNDNEWHHIVGVYDGVSQYLYVDEKLISQQEQTYSSINSANIRIGGVFQGEHNAGVIGSIDEVKIYDTTIPEPPNTVPEPSILGLLALGGLGVLAKKKR